MQLKHILIALLALPLFSACYYDNEEELYPAGSGAPCDTTVTTYSARVAAIVQENCLSCHSTAASPGANNISLEGHANLKIYVDNGKLMGAITHTPGYSFMPKNEPKLTDCEIAAIQRWVSNGSQNN